MKQSALAAYGVLGLPLAMAMLPIYVLVPNFYAADLGLGLALTGSVLFLARLLDTVQDPWLGRLIDRRSPRGWTRLLASSALLLSLAMAALLVPPALDSLALAVWLGASLALAYTLHSLLNITYLAWGARLSDQLDVRTRVAAWREGAGLLGVVLASVLPSALATRYGMAAALSVFAATFAVLLCAAMVILLCAAPQPRRSAQRAPASWRQPLRNGAFRRLAGIFFINAVAVAIPATLALFFIADRLQLAQLAGLFLALYFLSGAAGLPLWSRLADRLGKRRSWRIGMLSACAAFVWALLLDPGSAWAYAAVCVLSGLALGADLALPPALLADVIPAAERDATAGYFGLWSLLAKLALAIAGLALPLLALTGYQPGTPAGWNLALIYAGLPCLLKLLAARLLTSMPSGEPTP
ncbi:MFS transporter [Stutzerimonas stutzeri]|uniref:MFS transporter n=1 Tax=Stutzerimonas stutzeri TaxID=316 RepID=UPI000838BF8C|nr:MFS transporter [Stutzerimonas stutzeri]OCX55122.1 sodium:melibiose symporter [Stutzerimonas stutzeri]